MERVPPLIDKPWDCVNILADPRISRSCHTDSHGIESAGSEMYYWYVFEVNIAGQSKKGIPWVRQIIWLK